jgi:hypothetical protein
MKTPLETQEKMENAWALVSRNVWPPHTPPGTAKDPLNSAFLDGVLLRPCMRTWRSLTLYHTVAVQRTC